MNRQLPVVGGAESAVRRALRDAGARAAPRGIVALAGAIANGAQPAFDALFAAEPRPACAKGCAYCCHLLVGVTIPEVAALVAYARHVHDEPSLRALADRARRAADATRGATPATYPSQRCTFLADDGACSAYVARPIACRGHHSFDVDACRDVFATRVDREAPKRPELLALRDDALAALRDVLRAARADDALYELNQAVAIALDAPDAFARWQRGEDPFAGARLPSRSI